MTDIKIGLRQLMRAPGVTMAAIVTLAVGLGATTAVLTFVAAVLSLASPSADMDRLVGVWSHNRAETETKNLVSIGDFVEWRVRATSFEAMAAWRDRAFNMSGGATAERVRATEVSPAYFDVFRWTAAIGRVLGPDDARPGAPRVVVLSQPFWRDHFGQSPDVIGHMIRLDGDPATIVGVLPATVVSSSMFTPLVVDDRAADRMARTLFVMARLRTGVSIEQARAEMTAVGAALESEHAGTNRGWTVNTRPLQEEFVGPQARFVFALLAATVLTVLLIGCVNVANLLLARGVTRQGEMAVRRALGANGWRLTRQLLVECGLLTACGAIASVLVAQGALSVMFAMLPVESPWVADGGIDVSVLVFTLVGATIATLAAGVVPALHARRANLLIGLHATSRSAAVSPRRLTRALVGAEVALAVLLLVMAGLLTRTLIALERLEPGFDVTHLLTARVSLPERLPESRASQWVAGALAEIERLPGVAAAGATSRLPFAGSRFNPNLGLEIEGYVPTDDRGVYAVDYSVTHGYFDTIRIELVDGRRFTPADRSDGPPVAAINQAMAARYWGTRSPLGSRIRIGAASSPSAPWRTIVGVVGNIRNDDADQPPLPYLYLPFAQRPVNSVSFAIRTSRDPTAIAGALRQALRVFDPDQALYDVQTMEAVLAGDLEQSRFLIRIMEIFAAIALGLAGVGIWGVLAQAVGQRTREIGPRVALGATAREVIRMVVLQGLVPVGLGLIVGLALGLAAARVMRNVLFEVSPTDPTTLAVTCALLILVAVAAALGPAARAARLDPLVALRDE